MTDIAFTCLLTATVLLGAACHASPPPEPHTRPVAEVDQPAPQHPDTAVYAGGDGRNCEHAVVVKVTEHLRVVHAERQWLAWRYPGGGPRGQAVLMKGDRAFDSIRYETAEGDVIDVCFDVTRSMLAGGR
jgi:hypothetical protein